MGGCDVEIMGRVRKEDCGDGIKNKDLRIMVVIVSAEKQGDCTE